MPTADHITELTFCPLCASKLQIKANTTDKDTFLTRCSSCGTFEITEECMIFTDMHAILRQRASKLSKWVKEKNSKGDKWPMITTSMLEK